MARPGESGVREELVVSIRGTDSRGQDARDLCGAFNGWVWTPPSSPSLFFWYLANESGSDHKEGHHRMAWRGEVLTGTVYRCLERHTTTLSSITGISSITATHSPCSYAKHHTNYCRRWGHMCTTATLQLVLFRPMLFGEKMGR